MGDGDVATESLQGEKENGGEEEANEEALVQLLQKRREERRLKQAVRAPMASGIMGIKRSASAGNETSRNDETKTHSGVMSIKRTASEGKAGFCLEPGHQNFELNMCV